MAVTLVPAPPAPKWWQPLVGPMFGALLSGVVTGGGMIWATATERAETRSTLNRVEETMRGLSGRVIALEISDREGLLIPGRLDGHAGRLGTLEQQQREAQQLDRSTNGRLTAMETSIKAIEGRLGEMVIELRGIRDGRRAGATPEREPSFRQN
ncbi:hypothetical protein EDC65_2232 [Stella humosa]|uniref:Uncharacterized protein n=1 Tax=Stella humosa TaxID=94 RepID=A0A3N1M9S6_9PROT|nr:hypothetical protein [Stella humosa]ROQ00433.1 hypothetical protein EDC65_2232 [Stella humosa]BBK30323.1 hypothetical protein STHU_09570 [Stella humosa]